MFYFSMIVMIFGMIVVFKTIRIVPQQMAYVVERLGRYHRTLDAGLHIIIPFLDSIRDKHSLKEVVLDIPEQICITRDNVQVGIDGVIFFRVTDARNASYGVNNYVMAVIQLAQTTLRSEIGKIDLDRSFEERQQINNAVVMEIDKATDPWGVKVLRYELKSITPPKDVLEAMEKQMRAEREKRAVVLTSEGERDARINRAEGQKQEVIRHSEADKQKQINEAEGKAQAILAVALATAKGLKDVAESLNMAGGLEAAKLQVAKDYVHEFGKLAKETNTLIIPTNVQDLSGMVATAMSVFERIKSKDAA